MTFLEACRRKRRSVVSEKKEKETLIKEAAVTVTMGGGAAEDKHANLYCIKITRPGQRLDTPDCFFFFVETADTEKINLIYDQEMYE